MAKLRNQYDFPAGVTGLQIPVC
ncbi:MAG: hypothetical protein QOH27_4408, partial [Mycobacterium sp.]|nr:hypothetical protein [Mycobacterium sp.]